MKESEIRDPKVLEEYLALVNADVQALFNPKQFEKIPCPICGEGGYTEEFEKSGFHYVTCHRCETLYANPRPSQAQLESFYSHSVSSKFWVEKFFFPFEYNAYIMTDGLHINYTYQEGGYYEEESTGTDHGNDSYSEPDDDGLRR